MLSAQDIVVIKALKKSLQLIANDISI